MITEKQSLMRESNKKYKRNFLKENVIPPSHRKGLYLTELIIIEKQSLMREGNKKYKRIFLKETVIPPLQSEGLYWNK